MKQHLIDLLSSSLAELIANGQLPIVLPNAIQIERSKDPEHGDYATNIALTLAKAAQMPPRKLAQLIVEHCRNASFIKEIQIAGPGFINFYLYQNNAFSVIDHILKEQHTFGHNEDIGQKRKINIEYVSANPTGPLHVGHGRGAAFGATLANLLKTVGYDVHQEYYVNDAGRQMDILATSVWLRYLEYCNEQITFPSNGYKGDYIKVIAQSLYQRYHHQFHHANTLVFSDLPLDTQSDDTGDKEAHIDALIANAKRLLGKQNYEIIYDTAIKSILEDIQNDLAEFNVHHDEWFSERSLYKTNKVKNAIEFLKTREYTFEKEGALWFKATQFGDEKDRVLVRSNGQMTYFASDVAYHLDKLSRGADKLIDIVGADHHGYLPRIKACLQAATIDPNCLSAIIVQFAVLYRGKEKVQMSTRSGEFVTLRQLREEVGNDAARFFYVMRKVDQHLDFDLELAKSKSNENPVYYIQYAHARVCSVFRQLEEKGWSHDVQVGQQHHSLLKETHEINLLRNLAQYPECLQKAALSYEPHRLCHYLRELAYDFHSYYNSHPFLVEDPSLRNARLNLIHVSRIVIANGLKLLGVSAPESM